MAADPVDGYQYHHPLGVQVEGLRRPGDDTTWEQLLRYLKSATNDCLGVRDRLRVLDERQSEAERKYAECRQRTGAAPGPVR